MIMFKTISRVNKQTSISINCFFAKFNSDGLLYVCIDVNSPLTAYIKGGGLVVRQTHLSAFDMFSRLMTSTHTHVHTYIHNTHVHTYIHTYIHNTHVHTYIRTSVCICFDVHNTLKVPAP